ncbi:MAG: hypothetical protein Q9215_005958, partial [Flavoplaca cf. flavocitrina]
MTDDELLETPGSNGTSTKLSHPPQPPSKPSMLRSSTQNDIRPYSKTPLNGRLNRKPAPPRPPKPRKLSGSDTHLPPEPSPLARSQPLSQTP